MEHIWKMDFIDCNKYKNWYAKLSVEIYINVYIYIHVNYILYIIINYKL